MKRKLFTFAQVFVLLFAGALAGVSASSVSKVLPGLAALGGQVAPASASALSVEPKDPARPLTPAGNGFTYQGSLKSGGSPANGNHDFQFALYDAASGGNLVAGTITQTLDGVPVTNGLFTIPLDFGSSAFDGNARYLQISVRQSGGGSYIPLSPRQPITPAPYALFALSSTPYKNVVTVAQAGGQLTSVQAALDFITDASSANRYLVKVGPGTYTEQVTMKQWVDIEGSGEGATKITFDGSDDYPTSTLLGASNAELRSLTVEMNGGYETSTAISNNGASPSLRNITVSSFGPDVVGVSNTNSASPSMSNVTVSVGGDGFSTGVYNNNSSPSMSNVTVTASSIQSAVGVSNFGASSPSIAGSSISGTASDPQSTSYGVSSSVTATSMVAIDNSKVTGGTYSIYNSNGGTTRVGASRLSGGGVLNNSGTLTCSGSYDASNKRLGSLCTPDTHTIYVAASGGDFTTITAALNSIIDNSSTNRYLVKVAPGTYNEKVYMKQWVDIEGSGQDVTTVTLTNVGGTVEGASNSELRSLTVENHATQNAAVAIGADRLQAFSLKYVTASAVGDDAFNVAYGISANGSVITMTNVIVTASGQAGYGLRGVSILRDFQVPSTVTIDDSVITVPVTGTTIFNDETATMRIGGSQLAGGPVSNSGTLTCAGVYDENYTFFANTCP
jgi:pectin methylesterase-like acyl-CoA thioesterase